MIKNIIKKILKLKLKQITKLDILWLMAINILFTIANMLLFIPEFNVNTPYYDNKFSIPIYLTIFISLETLINLMIVFGCLNEISKKDLKENDIDINELIKTKIKINIILTYISIILIIVSIIIYDTWIYLAFKNQELMINYEIYFYEWKVHPFIINYCWNFCFMLIHIAIVVILAHLCANIGNKKMDIKYQFFSSYKSFYK